MTVEEILKVLHENTAKKLLDIVKSEEVTAAELNVARQFLKDNGIDGTIKNSEPLLNLAKVMPFDPDEDEEAA
jgi:hypothetical protein